MQVQIGKKIFAERNNVHIIRLTKRETKAKYHLLHLRMNCQFTSVHKNFSFFQQLLRTLVGKVLKFFRFFGLSVYKSFDYEPAPIGKRIL